MKSNFTLLITMMIWTITLASAQESIIPISKIPFSIGESVKLKSEVLKEERTLNIYLPQSYQTDTTKRYPVIYLLDGSANEDFIHIAGLVQFGSFSWINMVPESIVVGISNVDRKRDFTYPSNNKQDREEFPTSGKSANFIQFIAEEVQPFINSYYKTTETKTLIGQSLGGLLATEILFSKPNMFDHYIIVSPSLWWSDQSLLKKNPANYKSGKSIYIAVSKEGPIMEQTARDLHTKLDQKKSKNTKLYFEFFEQQNHGDALHLAIYSAFEKIFAED